MSESIAQPAASAIMPPTWSQWDFVDALDDGIYGIDKEGRCTFVNRAGIEMLGYSSAEEMLGQDMHILIHHTRPDGSPYPREDCPLTHTFISGRPMRLSSEVLWRKDGTPLIVEYSSFPIFTNGTITGSVITFTDTAQRRSAQKRLAVQYTINRVLAGSSDLGTAAAQILAAIGSAFGWSLGAFWMVKDSPEISPVLRCAAVWTLPEATAEAQFIAGSEGLLLGRGEGLPGLVWEQGESVYSSNIVDEPYLRRRELAIQTGLRSALAFPLKAGKQVIGVVELLSRELVEIDDSARETLAVLGQQIGQFLERKRLEEELRASETLKGAILESALDCIITIDEESRILEFNPTAEKTFGHRRSEVLGRRVPDLIIPPEFRERHLHGLSRYLATGEGPLLGKRIELEALRADGSRFPVELAITAMRVDGKPRFTAYLRDITERKQAERDLLAAKEAAEDAKRRLQLALRSGRIGAWSWDFNADLLQADARTREIFELDASGPVPIQTFFERIHPDDRARVAAIVEEARRNRGEYDSEFRVVLPSNGEVHWVVSRGIVTDSGHASGLSMIGTTWDITERRRAEQEIRESEALRGAILESALDHAIFTTDPRGRITTWSPGAEAILGWTAEQAVGQSAWFIFTPEDRAAGAPEREVETARRTGRVEDRRWHIRSDGSRVFLNGSMRSLRDPASGIERGFLKVARDETKRQRNEEAVRRSEAKFRTLANAIPQLAWITDPDGSINWYNRRWYEYTGTTFEEMKGWGWKKVHHPDYVQEVADRLNHTFAAGEPWEDTFPLRGKDGQYRWFLSRAVPIRDVPDEEYPEGRILGWFGTNTDITDMRESEERLAAARDAADSANKAKSQFLANMSHELRTPLNAVILYSELLEEQAEDSGVEEFIPELKKINAAGKQLLALVNDVLDLSKIESGKMDLYLETFDIAPLVEDVTAVIQPLIQKNHNRLSVDVATDVGSMYADMTKVRQVLFNLLSNASKFTQNGEVSLRVQREAVSTGSEELTFAVTDTGIGMTDDEMAKLFQPFTQADASTTRKFGGTGLGLTITKRFCEMMGGTIAVQSEVGKGSTFTVCLPAQVAMPAEESGEDSEADKSAVRSAGETSAPVVLVIDDDPSVREVLLRFLAKEGFRIETAADGETGLRLAKELHPAAITLDVMMPRMDGWGVLSSLKADAELAEIPVILLTMVGSKDIGYTLGASEYLMKPVDRRKLLALLTKYAQPRTGALSALIIEDDETVRDAVRSVLEKQGWTVREAANGRVGLEQVAAEKPGLILLDLMMPEMDGFEFAAELRKNAAWRDIPVVVVTAKDVTAEDRRRLNGSVERVLSKGAYTRDELLSQVGSCVASVVQNRAK